MGNRRSRTVHHHHTTTRVVRDDSAARNHQYRMEQLRDQRTAQSANEEAAKVNATRQHQYRMQQLDKQKQIEMQREAERQRAAKRAFDEKMKTLKLQEKNAAITRVKTDIAGYESKNKQIVNKLSNELKPSLEESEKNIVISESEMKSFIETSTKRLDELDKEIKKYDEKYKAADGKIRDAIKTTDVDESNIPQFLDLVNDGLLFATMKGQQEQDKMLAKLKVFADLIERTCASKLKIDTYFKDVGLERLTPILGEDGYTNMDDIKCTDNDEWKEILSIVEDGVKRVEKLKKNQKLFKRERSALNKACMKSDKTWLGDQNDIKEIVRISLMTAAPKLSNFFGTLHKAIGEIDKLLSYEAKLNSEQQKAIKSAPMLIEEITELKDEKENIENNNEYVQSKDVSMIQFTNDDINTTNEQCKVLAQIVVHKLHITEELAADFVIDEKEVEKMEAEVLAKLKPKQKELNEKQQQLDLIGTDLELVEDEILMLEEDEDTDEDTDDDNSDEDDDEKEDIKQQKKELKKKKKKLRLKQKKMEIMVKKYEKEIDRIEMKRGEIISMEDVLREAYTVAMNIEDSTLQIIKSQCVTRQSILLARELLKYKPAKPAPEAKPLWVTITKGIGDIFANALQLSKISATYFGFFIKFQHSFDDFVAKNKMKKNVSLMVAAQYLVRDVNDIQKFQQELDDKVSTLRASAIKTIRDCVSHTVGAQEFDTAMSQRKAAESGLRVAHQKYNEFKFSFDNQFQEKFANQQQWVAKKRIVEYQMQELNKNVSMNQQWINQLAAQVKSLENLMVT